MDKWLEERLHGPISMDATLSIANGLERIDELWHLIPSHLHNEIRRTSLSHSQEDKLIFELSSNGAFSVQKHSQASRESRPSRSWDTLIWQTILPPIFLVFSGKSCVTRFPSTVGYKRKG